MKITKVEIFRANLPLKRPFRIALGVVEVAETMFLRLHGENGLYGMGEANPLAPVVGETIDTVLAASELCGRLVLGKNAQDIDGLTATLRAALPHNTSARSAFDMALYDLLGKAANLPLYALLAGSRRELMTDNTVGIDTHETMAKHALEFAERGFPAIKVKLGTAVADDVARIAAVRQAVGPDILLRIDANQGWSRIDARLALAQLAPFNIQYCEQPVKAWDIAGMAEVSAASIIPVMADESLFDDHDAVALLRGDACRYFNIKLAKSGGIHTALRINAIAEGSGIACMLGCMTETRLGLTAGAHFVSARPNIKFADLDGADMLRDDPVTGGMTYGAAGSISLPEGAGIGADIDADYLAVLQRIEVAG